MDDEARQEEAMHKQTELKDDGRVIIYYRFEREEPRQ